MLLDDGDASHAVERCWEVLRRKDVFLCERLGLNLATTCVLVAQMVQRLFAPVVVSPRKSCRTSRVYSITLPPPTRAMVTRKGKPSLSVYVNKCGILVRLGIAKSSNSGPSCQDGPMGVCDAVLRSDAAE